MVTGWWHNPFLTEKSPFLRIKAPVFLFLSNLSHNLFSFFRLLVIPKPSFIAAGSLQVSLCASHHAQPSMTPVSDMSNFLSFLVKNVSNWFTLVVSIKLFFFLQESIFFRWASNCFLICWLISFMRLVFFFTLKTKVSYFNVKTNWFSLLLNLLLLLIFIQIFPK